MWTLPLAFVLGACLGSFLNVCIDRLPQGQSLVKPPSHCPDCGRLLRPFDLVPILSYLWLRGRCRHCGSRIPRRILAVELGTGLLIAFLCLKYGLSAEFLIVSFYACLFLVLAVIDLEQGLILNSLVYPGMALSLILAPLWSKTAMARPITGGNTMLESFLSSLAGGGVFFLLFLAIYLIFRGGMGGGDVKMAGLIGLAVGLFNVPVALLTAVVSGALASGILLLFGIKRMKDALPFAPFLSLGALVALLWGGEIGRWYLGLMGG